MFSGAVLCGAAFGVLAADRVFTLYASVKPFLESQGDRLPGELRRPDAAKWTAWTQR
ncbi:MAG TPA: hypothetical protein VGN17_21230 [Bryobacteraceae bacterium]|jgi:hypothetical protein